MGRGGTSLYSFVCLEMHADVRQAIAADKVRAFGMRCVIIIHTNDNGTPDPGGGDGRPQFLRRRSIRLAAESYRLFTRFGMGGRVPGAAILHLFIQGASRSLAKPLVLTPSQSISKAIKQYC